MIRAVLDSYGESIRERPIWQRVRCVAHDDDHASASVNTQLDKLYCHVCGRSWNPTELVMQMEGLEKDAAERRAEELARDFGDTLQSKPLEGHGLPGRARDFNGAGRRQSVGVRR